MRPAVSAHRSLTGESRIHLFQTSIRARRTSISARPNRAPDQVTRDTERGESTIAQDRCEFATSREFDGASQLRVRGRGAPRAGVGARCHPRSCLMNGPAFARRSNPAGGVARRSNTASILTPRAWPGGRLASLGARPIYETTSSGSAGRGDCGEGLTGQRPASDCGRVVAAGATRSDPVSVRMKSCVETRGFRARAS